MKNNESTAMTVADITDITPSGFVNADALALLQDVMAEDAAGLEFQLDRIKFAAGGTTILEIPGDGDEPEMVKSLSCVILFNHPAYAYYTNKYQGGNNPPDCGSFDGVSGIGNPGGPCQTCPFNKFGSGEGKAKACKNRRMLYVLREGEVFPLMLNLPTGSLKEFTNYVKHQAAKGRRLNQVVTKISIRRATSGEGMDFSQAQFAFERMLTAEERAVIAQMTEQVKSYSGHLGTAALVADEDNPFVHVDPETGEIIENET